ncbi:MAG: conditioned medium-induced protein 4 [Haloarculaceae archaeon]
MDEKTEELRDIFMDVSDEETVTESQADERGSLSTDEEGVDERLRAVIARMRDRYEFTTDLDDEALVGIVRGFYDGDDDATLAADLDISPEEAFDARMDLHLVADDDTDAPFDYKRFRERVSAGADEETLTEEFDLDEDTAHHYYRIAATQARARTVSHRFRSELEDALADAALASRMTDAVKEDGLEEATEDMETDVSL